MSARHEPVLVREVLSFLAHGPGLYLDATLGDGGHAQALLDREPGARLIGTDRDPAALQSAGARLESYGARVRIAHARFHEIPAVLEQAGADKLAGALFDLGLSSRQIDDPSRGMSFMTDGPLDLRMDPRRTGTAAERLGQVSEQELATVLREHGDVIGAKRLARALITEVARGGLTTTRSLRDVIDRTHRGPPTPRRYAQVFQALRTWVNEEHLELEAALEWLPEWIAPGGVVVTLAYHSGEDRRIKRALRGIPDTRPARRQPDIARRPPERPWVELTPGVVTPSEQEVAANPRARSARMRAFRRSTP